MNRNGGGSAYPPNPDVKSGSCLIAGFQPLTVVHPTYWNAYKTESGATFSIDMVRLKLSFINGKGEWLSTHAQTFDCDSMSAWTSKIRPGGWYELWSFELGDSSIALGIAAQMRRDAEREIKELDKRKECLRQEVEEMEAATPSLPEGVRTLWKARNDGSREDTLGSDLEGLRSQISDLSSQIADVDRRADEIERGLPILRARRASLGERFGVARAAVVKAIEGLREVPNIVSAWAQELARKMGKHLFDPNSIDYRSREMWEATRAVDALNRDRPHAPQQRGRGAR